MFVRHHVFLRSLSSASSFIVVVVVVVIPFVPFGPGRDCFPRRRVVAPAVSPLPFVVGESVVCDSVPELRGLPADQLQR